MHGLLGTGVSSECRCGADAGCQRLSKDFKHTIASTLVWLDLAAIRILLPRFERAEISANTVTCWSSTLLNQSL